MNKSTKKLKVYYDNLIALRTHFIENKASIQPNLDMSEYRSPEFRIAEHSFVVGCVLGHAISMPRFKPHFKLIHKYDATRLDIDFDSFARDAFNLEPNYSLEWDDLFGSQNCNDIDEFIERLDKHLAITYPKFIKGDTV